MHWSRTSLNLFWCSSLKWLSVFKPLNDFILKLRSVRSCEIRSQLAWNCCSVIFLSSSGIRNNVFLSILNLSIDEYLAVSKILIIWMCNEKSNAFVSIALPGVKEFFFEKMPFFLSLLYKVPVSGKSLLHLLCLLHLFCKVCLCRQSLLLRGAELRDGTIFDTCSRHLEDWPLPLVRGLMKFFGGFM